jgi:hypothetical protein
MGNPVGMTWRVCAQSYVLYAESNVTVGEKSRCGGASVSGPASHHYFRGLARLSEDLAAWLRIWVPRPPYHLGVNTTWQRNSSIACGRASYILHSARELCLASDHHGRKFPTFKCRIGAFSCRAAVLQDVTPINLSRPRDRDLINGR